MKKIETNKLSNIVAGNARQCLLDGWVAVGYTLVGGIAGGGVGALGGFLAGIGAGISDGCFS